MKVLVVDDSVVMRLLVKRALAEYAGAGGVEVVEASDGREGLAALDAGDVGLVLVDWNMPVLDGLEFVRAVRGSGRDVPIIMISAVTDDAAIFEACEAGVTDYIEKPVRPSELAERVKDFL